MLLSVLPLVVLLGSAPFSQLAAAAPIPPQDQHRGRDSLAVHSSKTSPHKERHGGKRRPRRHRVYDEVEDFLPSNKYPVLDGHGNSGWESDIILATELVSGEPEKLIGISLPKNDEIKPPSDQDEKQSYLKYVFAVIPPESSPAPHQPSGHWIVQHVRPPFPIHQGYTHREGYRKHSAVATLCHHLVALKDYSLRELRQLSAAAPSAAYMSSKAGEIYKDHVEPTLAYVFCENPFGYFMGGLFLVFLVSVALREYLSARRAARLQTCNHPPLITFSEKDTKR